MSQSKVFILAAAALSLSGAAMLNGQTGSPIGGPILGYVADTQSRVRPILGLEGASTLGRPRPNWPDVRLSVVSSLLDYALVLTGDEKALLLVQNLNDEATFSPIADAASGAGQIVLSGAGTSAVLYFPDTQRIQVLSGLPNSPRLSWAADLSDAGGLSTIAVNDDATAILAARGDPGQRSILVLTPGQSLRYISLIAEPAAMAFLPNGRDAVVADGAANQVFLIRGVTDTPSVNLLADGTMGISRPAAVAASTDGQRIFVANAEPGSVTTLSLSGEQPSSVPCMCTPTGLHSLRGESAFRLNGVSAGPLWVFDGHGSEPHVFFVPAGEAEPPTSDSPPAKSPDHGVAR